MYYKMLSAIIILIVSSLSLISQTADEIIAKSIEATGGQAKYESVKSSYTEMSIKVMGMTATIKTHTKDKKLRLTQDGMGKNVLITYDGEKGWMKQGDNVTEIPYEQIDMITKQSNADIGSMWTLKNTKDVKIEKVGKTRVDGVTAFNLKMTDKDNNVSNIFIDAKTYLPFKITATSEKGDVSINLKEYKDFDGIKRPSKITMDNQGMEIVMSIDEFKINPPMDDSLFAKPE